MIDHKKLDYVELCFIALVCNADPEKVCNEMSDDMIVFFVNIFNEGSEFEEYKSSVFDVRESSPVKFLNHIEYVIHSDDCYQAWKDRLHMGLWFGDGTPISIYMRSNGDEMSTPRPSLATKIYATTSRADSIIGVTKAVSVVDGTMDAPYGWTNSDIEILSRAVKKLSDVIPKDHSDDVVITPTIDDDLLIEVKDSVFDEYNWFANESKMQGLVVHIEKCDDGYLKINEVILDGDVIEPDDTGKIIVPVKNDFDLSFSKKDRMEMSTIEYIADCPDEDGLEAVIDGSPVLRFGEDYGGYRFILAATDHGRFNR